MNKVKASKEDKKVFNDLNKLIIDINNNKVKKEDAVERLNKSISDLDQLKQKQSTVLRNKMVQVVYQLFNSFGFNKEFAPLFSQIKSEQTEEKMQIPLWFKINKLELDELKSDIYDNQNNKDFKITINKKTYDLKNAKKIWTKITNCEVSKNEAKKLYKELRQKEIDALEREKSNSIKKNNILKILGNIDAIFTGAYLHNGEMPKEIFERNVAESVKLRRGRIAEIEEEEENIKYILFNDYFINYQSPSDMYKKLRRTKDERNEDRVYVIKKVLNKMKKIIKNVYENKRLKIEEN